MQRARVITTQIYPEIYFYCIICIAVLTGEALLPIRWIPEAPSRVPAGVTWECSTDPPPARPRLQVTGASDVPESSCWGSCGSFPLVIKGRLSIPRKERSKLFWKFVVTQRERIPMPGIHTKA